MTNCETRDENNVSNERTAKANDSNIEGVPIGLYIMQITQGTSVLETLIRVATLVLIDCRPCNHVDGTNFTTLWRFGCHTSLYKQRAGWHSINSRSSSRSRRHRVGRSRSSISSHFQCHLRRHTNSSTQNKDVDDNKKTTLYDNAHNESTIKLSSSSSSLNEHARIPLLTSLLVSAQGAAASDYRILFVRSLTPARLQFTFTAHCPRHRMSNGLINTTSKSTVPLVGLSRWSRELYFVSRQYFGRGEWCSSQTESVRSEMRSRTRSRWDSAVATENFPT